MASHEIPGDPVQVHKGGGKHWHCAATIAGRQCRSPTREEGLAEAKQFAEDWLLEPRGKAPRGRTQEIREDVRCRRQSLH